MRNARTLELLKLIRVNIELQLHTEPLWQAFRNSESGARQVAAILGTFHDSADRGLSKKERPRGGSRSRCE